jgi:hypothetical protein
MNEAIALTLDAKLWKVDDTHPLGQWRRPRARLYHANLWYSLHLLLLLRRPCHLKYHTHRASINSNTYKVERQQGSDSFCFAARDGTLEERVELSFQQVLVYSPGNQLNSQGYRRDRRNQTCGFIILYMYRFFLETHWDMCQDKHMSHIQYNWLIWRTTMTWAWQTDP